ncbi:hypothetical protein CHLRE_02g076000v5 [Chlamydomonas reinhardtii]|uniref:non-specific serine/threonine protein kinase n=1 Tax=Chlamydomonas reinhardtii TaxID=3055 RepID=A0A2K3E058_CHLRE|nr:uncharacterized protein CHLRE_02g076000v5 [Chlamydomonas reinhardtii]PNW86180.1 hypothetical protein CHLRE_02g076000v5 [Chlamydomonas reinhardtii]
MANQISFSAPHPLGLDPARYSHPVRLLGTGSFGKVYLCCLRTLVPPQPPQPDPAASAAAHDASGGASTQGGACSMQTGTEASYCGGDRMMSIDLDGGSHHHNNGTTHHGGPTAAAAGGQGQGQPACSAAGAGSAQAANGHHSYARTAHEGTAGGAPAAEPAYEYQWVAVKIFKPLVQCDLRSLEYLKREVVCQRRLQHQHVIGFREVGIASGDLRLYLALEYANGGNLKQWLAERGGRLAEPVARWFTQQLVYGLAYCHAHGVYNRDIKPENLLLDTGGGGLEQPLLKVADFGLAKSSNDSAPNSCVGSPNFMAPEVFTSKQYDGRKADVFSCGVVLYQLVFGALPFHRTLDGKPLDFKHNMRDILRNMKAEAWPHLIPTAPPAQPGAGTGAAAGAAGPQPVVAASAGLLDLLTGMLRYDPARRLSLYEVKRHPWYREGLSDEVYALLLEDDAGSGKHAEDGGCGWHGAGQQSVEVIEQEFARILEFTAALHQEAAQKAVDSEFQLE